MSRALLPSSDAITLMTRSEVRHDLNYGVLTELRCTYLDDVLLNGVTTRRRAMPGLSGGRAR